MGSRSFCPPPPPEWPAGAANGDGTGGHYVVACWPGERRKGGAGDEILAAHLDALGRVPHDLAQVTLCVPECPGRPAAFDALMRSLPARIQKARVRVLERPNRGLSYGSWSDAVTVWRGEFPWHFLMEDDFVLCRPGFDRELASLAGGGPAAVCGGVSPCGTYAEVSNMAASDAVMQAVWRRSGGVLPHTPGEGYESDRAQSMFGQAFWRAGVRLVDLRGHAGVSFGEGGTRREWRHPSGWMMVCVEHWLEAGGDLGGIQAHG